MGLVSARPPHALPPQKSLINGHFLASSTRIRTPRLRAHLLPLLEEAEPTGRGARMRAVLVTGVKRAARKKPSI
jgi:hypothetical protein